jgi:hypothetical protein
MRSTKTSNTTLHCGKERKTVTSVEQGCGSCIRIVSKGLKKKGSKKGRIDINRRVDTGRKAKGATTLSQAIVYPHMVPGETSSTIKDVGRKASIRASVNETFTISRLPFSEHHQQS